MARCCLSFCRFCFTSQCRRMKYEWNNNKHPNKCEQTEQCHIKFNGHMSCFWLDMFSICPSSGSQGSLFLFCSICVAMCAARNFFHADNDIATTNSISIFFKFISIVQSIGICLKVVSMPNRGASFQVAYPFTHKWRAMMSFFNSQLLERFISESCYRKKINKISNLGEKCMKSCCSVFDRETITRTYLASLDIISSARLYTTGVDVSLQRHSIPNTNSVAINWSTTKKAERKSERIERRIAFDLANNRMLSFCVSRQHGKCCLQIILTYKYKRHMHTV